MLNSSIILFFASNPLCSCHILSALTSWVRNFIFPLSYHKYGTNIILSPKIELEIEMKYNIHVPHLDASLIFEA